MIGWGGMKSKLLVISYWLLVIGYSIFSYALLDLNLTLTSFNPYLWLQKKMRWWGYSYRPQATMVFIILSLLLFAIYFFLARQISQKKALFLAVTSGLILVLAYPAFSHDIFNYIFNAKMVVLWGADPHRQTAIEFSDPMLDFMRNVHTPAPYFYGWTIISLLPFLMGLNRIFLELITFKFFSLAFFLLNFFFLSKIYSILKFKQAELRLTLFLLNPLILFEAVGMGHNDLSMMTLALASFYFLVKFKKRQKLRFILFSVFCFLLSVSIKYATIVLLPLLFLWYSKPKFDLGFWGAVLLLLLPFSRPLSQLHSWYFLWPLTWVFLSRDKRRIELFLGGSFFAFLRYAPYLWYGYWDPPVPVLRLIIYLLAPLAFLLCRWKRKSSTPGLRPPVRQPRG